MSEHPNVFETNGIFLITTLSFPIIAEIRLYLIKSTLQRDGDYGSFRP